MIVSYNQQWQDGLIDATVTLPTGVTGVWDVFVIPSQYAIANTDPSSTERGQMLTAPSPKVTITRQGALQFTAVGTPQGGTFSDTAAPYCCGPAPVVSFASGVNEQTNPTSATLSNPTNTCGGIPCQGSISKVTATYAFPPSNQYIPAPSGSDYFYIATFGLSCYYTTTQQEWGTAPDSCKSISIDSVLYQGSAPAAPSGLPPGSYCNSFLAELREQGSAYLADGTPAQYDKSLGYYLAPGGLFKSADNTVVVAGQTIARDRSIIPGRGVLVDFNYSGLSGMHADDAGGRIQGYRIDVYGGAGAGKCSNYANPMAIGSCSPSNSNCPGSTEVRHF